MFQPAPILFPDAELWAVNRLRPLLSARTEPYAIGAKVGVAVPSVRPDRLVTIRRDGGAADGAFDNPRFGVNVWAKTEQDATDLARLVAALLWSTPGDGICVHMEQVSGPSPIPDAQPRRYSVFEARLRGSDL